MNKNAQVTILHIFYRKVGLFKISITYIYKLNQTINTLKSVNVKVAIHTIKICYF